MIGEKVWLAHDGSGCPVETDTIVYVRFRNGTEHGPYPARRWRWRSWHRPLHPTEHDIAQWRKL